MHAWQHNELDTNSILNDSLSQSGWMFVFCQGIKYRQGEAVFLTPKCLDGGDRKEDLQVRSSSEKKTAANLSLRNHLKSKIVDETQVFYSFK